MSNEFNPMEDLLADLLSTWDEEPAEEEAPVVIEAAPVVVAAPVVSEPPRIWALPTPPKVVEPIAVVAREEPVEIHPPADAVGSKVPEPVPEPVVVAPPQELALERPEDPRAAAACAAILARMEREFSDREPQNLPMRKARLAADVPRFVVFAVRDMMFAVPIGRVLETDRMTPVTPLPGAALGVKGLTNLRGEVVPVIDLREVLGWAPPENPAGRRMLVIQDGNRQPLTALLVDQVKGLAAFPPTAWKAAEMAGAHAAEGFVEAVAEREQEWISRLNLDRILNETHLPSLAAA